MPSQLFFPFSFRTVFERVGTALAPAPIPAEEQERKPASAAPQIWKQGIVLHVVRHPRARRYLLRLQSDGSARLVIPRRGSRREALRFLERNEAWLLERFERWKSSHVSCEPWANGASFLFRGEMVALEVQVLGDKAELKFAGETLRVSASSDYRNEVFDHLRSLAKKELPPRVWELAQAHCITVHRVTVRAQKTRWGSCSSRGTISLNWRLIQAPQSVRDYLIIHELMHRKQMNHSARFWNLVEGACPEYRAAEAWLKRLRLEEMA